MEPDARLLQGPVGDIVPGVHHHLAGADGQGIGAVAPLLPGGVDLAALAAGDQCHLIQLQVLLQDVLQPAVLLTDFHLPVFVQLHDEHRNLLEDVGMDGELVPVHHGEHGIQMHEGAALGNVEGQNFLESLAL